MRVNPRRQLRNQTPIYSEILAYLEDGSFSLLQAKSLSRESIAIIITILCDMRSLCHALAVAFWLWLSATALTITDDEREGRLSARGILSGLAGTPVTPFSPRPDRRVSAQQGMQKGPAKKIEAASRRASKPGMGQKADSAALHGARAQSQARTFPASPQCVSSPQNERSHLACTVS